MPVPLDDEVHYYREVVMQIDSNPELSSRAKANGASKRKPTQRAKTTAKSDTLHLKAKYLVATPVTDVAAMIATTAYYRAAQRGFEPGHELDDWLQAEQIVRAQLSS
jgi:hypothetical protein